MYRIGNLSPINWLILGAYALHLLKLSANFKSIYSRHALLATMMTNVLLLGLSDSIAQSLRSAIRYKSEQTDYSEENGARARFYEYVLRRGRPRRVWLDEEGDNLADLGLTEISSDEEPDENSHFVQYEYATNYTDFNFRRLALFSLYGFLNSFVQCPWYGFLRSAYSHDNKLVIVVQRVLVDQVFYSPIMLCVFLYYLSVVVERNNYNIIESSGFWMMYVQTLGVNLCVWPAAQFFNFLLVPSPAQIPFSSSLSVLWNTYLSLNTT